MRFGTLDDHFRGVAWKRLTRHEVDPKTSRGHEFQGVGRLRDLLGDAKRDYPATYMLLRDEEPDTVIRSTATWYDSRQNQPDRSAEWRLYYSSDAERLPWSMKEGDLLVIALTRQEELVVLLAAADSSREAEVRLLFGVDRGKEKAQLRLFEGDEDVSDLRARILDALGITLPVPDPVGDGPAVMSLADELMDRFPDALPAGKDVSAIIRKRLVGIDAIQEPDIALVRWIEAEETVFRLWEDALIERRLTLGFDRSDGRKDVDGFRVFSMKIRQSRVSRAGGALQWHTAAILTANRIQYEAQAHTEHGEKPDFLFPGSKAYAQDSFPANKLRVLGVKFTAKDRWRQILNEAARIRTKHLLTLEAPISDAQVGAMTSAKLVPVIPATYQQVFSPVARTHLVSLRDFISEVRQLQGR